MSSFSPLPNEQESTLRYLASRMMGDTWIARKLARELPDLSPMQQLERLRGFLAASTVSNTIAAEICNQHGIIIGIPTAENTVLGNSNFSGEGHRMCSRYTHADALVVSQYYAEQLLSACQHNDGISRS
jgi:hypothetical protein